MRRWDAKPAQRRREHVDPAAELEEPMRQKTVTHDQPKWDRRLAPQKSSTHGVFTLVRRDAVQASRCRQAALSAEVRERAIALDLENPHGAARRIE